MSDPSATRGDAVKSTEAMPPVPRCILFGTISLRDILDGTVLDISQLEGLQGISEAESSDSEEEAVSEESGVEDDEEDDIDGPVLQELRPVVVGHVVRSPVAVRHVNGSPVVVQDTKSPVAVRHVNGSPAAKGQDSGSSTKDDVEECN